MNTPLKEKINYQDLFYFIKVIESGSLAAAANKLDLPTSTLSRRLIMLEKSVGVQLLHRNSRSFGLTNAGARFFNRLKSQFTDIEFETENLMTEMSGLTGDIRVSAPLSFGRHIVNKWVIEFMEKHPNISVEVLLSNQPIDLVKNSVDLALRLGNLGISDWISRELAEIRYQLVASPEYLAKHGPLTDPKQLELLPTITTATTPLWRLTGPDGDITVHPHSHYRSDVVSACVDAAAAGLGVCLLPVFAVKRAIDEGKLVIVLPDWEAKTKPLRALYPKRDHIPTKNRVFISFIMDKAKEMQL